MIGLISSGTIATSLVIIIQRQGRAGGEMGEGARRVGRVFTLLTLSKLPAHLNLSRRKRVCREKVSQLNIRRCLVAKGNGTLKSLSMELSEPVLFGGRRKDKRWDKPTAVISPAQVRTSLRSPADLKRRGFQQSGSPERVSGGLSTSTGGLEELNQRLRRIGESLERLGEGVRVRELRERRRAEWEWLATVVERAALLTFITSQFLITGAILSLGYSRTLAQTP